MSSACITDLYFSDAPLGGAKGAVHGRHKHNVYQMLYIVEGSVSCEIAGDGFTATAPALVFIGNYEPHIVSAASERYARYVLTLDPEAVDASLRPKLLASVFSFHPSGFAHALDITPIAEEIRILMENLIAEWSLPKEEKLEGGETLLLSALLYRIRRYAPSYFAERAYGGAELIVASVRRELEANFSERLSLERLAERHHISRYYLAHIFKKGTGYSLSEYLMLCRISYACRCLAEDTAEVRAIAEAAGFHDMSNFSRAFKETVGLSPSAFRKKARSEPSLL